MSNSTRFMYRDKTWAPPQRPGKHLTQYALEEALAKRNLTRVERRALDRLTRKRRKGGEA